MFSCAHVTHDDEEETSHLCAALLDGGGVVGEAHAVHGHEHEQHGRQPQQAGADHEGAGRQDVG